MRRYRVALLGSSFARLVQAPAFGRHPGFDLVAIAGSDPAKTRRIADELGVRGAYADWRELLEREKPELVSVVTPVFLHHPMMLAAIAAGAHVLCEKPTAMTRGQALEMRDAAVAAGRVAGINHEFRFLPARVAALAMIRRGDIGRPRRGEIVGRYPLWHRPESRGMTWLSDARRGGGILGALGSHHTDCLRTVFGEPRTALASVRVDQPRRGPVEPGGSTGTATADDGFTVQYGFDDGATAIVDCLATAPYRWERYEIHGEEATLRWDDSGWALWRLAAGRDPEPVDLAPWALERVDGDPPLVAPFRVIVQRLYDAIDSGAPLEPGFARDGVAVQFALDAVRASSEAGARVRVEPVPEPSFA